MSVLTPPAAAPAPGGAAARPGWGRAAALACVPAAACYLAATVILALVTLMASGAKISLAGVAQAGAVAFLAVHQVPITIGAAPLGVLPLLPTLLLGALTGRMAWEAARGAEVRTLADGGWLTAAIGGGHGAVGAVLALLAMPDTVSADPLRAAVGCAFVAGASAAIGLTLAGGPLRAAAARAPDWVAVGVAAGVRGLGVLAGAATAAVLAGLIVSAPELPAFYQVTSEDPGGVFGLTLLSIGYLPNAAVAALSWLAGSGFSVGALVTSPVGAEPGPLPPVPLLAAVPQGPAQPWWALALVIPVLGGVLIGRWCAAAGPDPGSRLRALGAAAGVLVAACVVLASLAGGRLGAGVFDPVEVPAGSFAIAVLLTTLLGGAAGALLIPTPALDAQAPPEPDATEGATQGATQDGTEGATDVVTGDAGQDGGPVSDRAGPAPPT